MSLARAIALTDNRVYTGPAQYLSDPTDLLHIWSLRDVSRNSGRLGATLKRSLDGVEKDFGFTSKGFPDRAEVLAWAGASAVTVVRLWGLGGEQLGSEKVTNGGPGFANTAGWAEVNSPTNSTITAVGGNLRISTTNSLGAYGVIQVITGLTAGKTYRVDVLFRVVSPAVPPQTATMRWANGNVTSGFAILCSTESSEFRDKFATFTPSGTTVTIALINGGLSSGVGTYITEFGRVSIREVLTANAVQTTALNQPPLDKTANPLRIAAAAGTSLVATMPSAISNAIMLRASGGNVYQETVSFTANQAYNVVSNQAFCERVILKSDTPVEDVAKVKANMVRGWKAVDEMQLGEELVVNGGFDTDTVWAKGTGWAIAGGLATHTGGTPQYLNIYPSALVVGKTYLMTVSVAAVSGNSISLYLGNSPSIAVVSTTGTASVIGVATAVSLGIAIRGNSGTVGTTISIDNVSVREVLGGA